MYMQVTNRFFHVHTCFAVPFPYSMVETARCTSPICWCLDFEIIEARRQMRGTFVDAHPTNANRKYMRVGIFCWSSRCTAMKINEIVSLPLLDPAGVNHDCQS